MSRHWWLSVAVPVWRLDRKRVWLAASLAIVLAACVAVCSAAQAQGQAQGPLPDLNTATVSIGEPATVHVWNRPIVELRAKIGSLTPAMRVEAIEPRISGLPLNAPVDAIKAVSGSFGKISGYWIQIEGRTLFALTAEDLDPDADQTLEAFAAQAVSRLKEALAARADQRRLPVLLRGALFAVLATAAFAAVIWGITRLRVRALRRFLARTPDRPIRLRGVNLRPYLRAVEEGLIKLTALGSILVAAYLWLTVVLLQFAYSRPWGEGLGHWLSDLLGKLGIGAISAIPGLFTVVIIFLATRLVVQGVDRFFRSVEIGWLKVSWLEAETARATRRLAIVLIWIFALTVAYPYIPGSESYAFKGISVFVGLMVSLGSAGFVNQLMSGLVIVYSRALKPGDFVQVAGSEGTISEVGLLATKLVTPVKHEITIPNAVLVGSTVTNFSRLSDAQSGTIISTDVTIGYDTSWRQVHAMLQLAAERTALVRREPKPVVIQRALSDFYVAYQLLVSVDRPETRRAVLSELHANIQDVFNEYGVQIMSPNFVSQPEDKVYVPQEAWFPPPAAAPAATSGDKGSPPVA
jgi:small-conductance mechanosensitive channel